MKKIDLGQTVNTIANVGVIIGILLLVFELTQNREMMRAQIRNEIATSLSGALPAVMDSELADALFRADNGGEVTGAENYRISLANEILFRYWENAYYQYEQGLYDEIEFSGHRGAIAASINGRPRLAQYWCIDRANYAAPFVEFVDSVLRSDTCPAE
jgi:hypothetical protein